MTAKLSTLLVALAVIVPARVELLPGWLVPVPVVFLAAAVTVCVTLTLLIVHRARDVAEIPTETGDS